MRQVGDQRHRAQVDGLARGVGSSEQQQPLRWRRSCLACLALHRRVVARSLAAERAVVGHLLRDEQVQQRVATWLGLGLEILE